MQYNNPILKHQMSSFPKCKVLPMQILNLGIIAVHLYAYYAFVHTANKYDTLESKCEVSTDGLKLALCSMNTIGLIFNFLTASGLTKIFALYQRFAVSQMEREQILQIFINNDIINIDSCMDFIFLLIITLACSLYMIMCILLSSRVFTPCFINHLTNEYYVCSIIIIALNMNLLIGFITYAFNKIKKTRKMSDIIELVNSYYWFSKPLKSMSKCNKISVCCFIIISHMIALYLFHTIDNTDNKTNVQIIFWVGHIVDGICVFIMLYENSKHASQEYINLTILGTVVNFTCLMIGLFDKKLQSALEGSIMCLLFSNICNLVCLMTIIYTIVKCIKWLLFTILVTFVVLTKITCVYIGESFCFDVPIADANQSRYSTHCGDYEKYLKTGYYFTKEHVVTDSGFDSNVVIGTNNIDRVLSPQPQPQPIIYADSGVNQV